MLMSSITEGGVWAHLTIAKLVVSALTNVERHWSQSSNQPLALAIAKGSSLSVTARAPVVHLASVQVHVSGVNTSEGRHGRRSVSAFLVGSALAEGDDLLFGEVGDIVHWNGVSGRRALDNLGFGSEDISFVGFAFDKSGSVRKIRRNGKGLTRR